MHLIIARCSVEYRGRLSAFLPEARRLIIRKADGSVLIHADGGSYKPLNWMSPPATVSVTTSTETDSDWVEQWHVRANKSDDQLTIRIAEKFHESQWEMGVDPGLTKDGVEADLQHLLTENIEHLGEGFQLIGREYRTAIGPVDILARDSDGVTVAIELKRHGGIDGVEQLTRYLELLDRNPLLRPVRGIYAATQIKPQAKVLAQDRGIECVILDYDQLRGLNQDASRLF